MDELTRREAAVDRLVKIWPEAQLIAEGNRCHCKQALQFQLTLGNRLDIERDRLRVGCWCPACGFTNACATPLVDFLNRIIWVNPERLKAS